MKYPVIVIIFLAAAILLNACHKDEDIDMEKPEISTDFPNAFPKNCDTLYFGEPFEFKWRFSDNQELGSYSLDIHHNFDHHSHSTEVTHCHLDPKKDPVNPFVFIEGYSIPDGLKTYETSLTLTIPEGNDSGLFDEGDYHLFVSLTDKEGWSTIKGLSIKMLHR